MDEVPLAEKNVASDLDVMKSDILKELTRVFNKRVKAFFENDVNFTLETLVENKFNELVKLDQSSQDTSILDQTFLKSDADDRILRLEEIAVKKMDKVNAKVDDLCTQLKKRDEQISELTKENHALKNENGCLQSENLKLHESNANAEAPRSKLADERISVLEQRMDECAVGLDNQNQRGRLDIVEFGGVPPQGTAHRPEDCYEIIANFCDVYLGLKVRRYDISIAHRQFNPADKREQGRNYIPSIYGKFVNRFLAQEILKRKNRLKNWRNKLGGKFSLKPNLTLNRKMLWESTEEKLPDYRFKWITNGNIFVKKDTVSRRIKVESEFVLEQLANQREAISNAPTKTGGASTSPMLANPQSSLQKGQSSRPPPHSPSQPALPPPLSSYPPLGSQGAAHKTKQTLNHTHAQRRLPTIAPSTYDDTEQRQLRSAPPFVPYEPFSRNYFNRNTLLSPQSYMHSYPVNNSRRNINGSSVPR